MKGNIKVNYEVNHKCINKNLFHIISSIVRNNRLADYRKQLLFAKSKGYKLGGLLHFLHRKSNVPYVIVRHDVDIKDIGVKEMMSIDRDLGITSTWYFRWSTINKDMIHEIEDFCGEVGLHYETLAQIGIKKGIKNKNQITMDVISKALEQLESQIYRFRKENDISGLTIASHGDPWNRSVEMANNEIITKEFCKKVGIEIEAYDDDLLSMVDCYISDASIIYNYGWSYRTSLKEAILKGNKVIYFLSHPNHWHFTPISMVRMLARLLINKGIFQEDKVFRSKYSSK
jgi:hypothetical protein